MDRISSAIFGMISLLVLSASVAIAQPELPPDNEKIRALRVAFLTQQLDLSPEEAQQFWPVYNAFHEEIRALQEERRSALMNIHSMELNEQDLEERIQKGFALEEDLVALRRRYHKQFTQVLSVQKVAAMYAAELRFQRRVLEELHKRKVRRFRNSQE